MATHCSSDYIYSIVDAHLHELGVESVTSREIVDVVEGYAGDGLGSSAKEETGEGGADGREPQDDTQRRIIADIFMFTY